MVGAGHVNYWNLECELLKFGMSTLGARHVKC
jgi:hypothetical protein